MHFPVLYFRLAYKPYLVDSDVPGVGAPTPPEAADHRIACRPGGRLGWCDVRLVPVWTEGVHLGVE